MRSAINFRLGLRAFKARKFVRAKALFRSVFDQTGSPERYNAGFNLALVHRELGEKDSALSLHKRLEKLVPDDFENIVALANLYAETGQLARALKTYDRALKLRSRDERVHYNIGITHEERGDRRRALAWYNRSIRLNPDYLEAVMRKAGVLEEMNRGSAALSAIEKLLKRSALSKGHFEIAYEKGCLLARLGRYKDALGHFKLMKKQSRKTEMKRAVSKLIVDLERRT